MQDSKNPAPSRRIRVFIEDGVIIGVYGDVGDEIQLDFGIVDYDDDYGDRDKLYAAYEEADGLPELPHWVDHCMEDEDD